MEQPRPEADQSVEQPISKTEQIRLRLQALKDQQGDKVKAWENEKKALAKEIVDMAEGFEKTKVDGAIKGNKDLAMKVNMAGNSADGYRGAEQKALQQEREVETSIEQLGREHLSTKAEFDALRANAVQEEAIATDAVLKEEYAQTIRDIDAELSHLETAYKVEQEARQKKLTEMREGTVEGGIKKKVGSVAQARMNQEFLAAQRQAAENPHAFATDTVLSSQKEFAGKDYTGKKSEIEQAVYNETHNRKEAAAAEIELPKIEAYVSSVEMAFGSFEQALREASAGIETDFNTLDSDFSDRIAKIVAEQAAIIKRGMNPGWWNATGKQMDAEQAQSYLRMFKSEQGSRIPDTYGKYGNVIVPIYYSLTHAPGFGNSADSTKYFDEGTFENNFVGYKVKQWKGLAQKNPGQFEGVAERAEALERRAENIKARRTAILEEYNRVYKELGRRNTQSSELLDRTFSVYA